VTIAEIKDDADMAETYLIGHIEERADGLEVMSPVSPIGGSLLGRRAGDRVEVTLENGAKVAVDIVSVETH
jgi:transcription elongation factor GreA